MNADTMLNKGKELASELLFDDNPNDSEEIKKKKHKKEIRGLVIGLITLAVIAWFGNNMELFGSDKLPNDPILKQFEQFSPITYPEVSYVDAFSLYFEDAKWSTIQTENADVVEFNGVCYYGDQRSNVCLQFSLSDGSCEVTYMDVNGQTGNIYDISNLIQSVFQNAYQEKGL